MKMKKFILLTALLLGLTTQAATLSTNATAGIKIIQQGQFKINSLSVVNATTNTVYVSLVDCPTNVLTFLTAQYTNVIRGAAAQVVTTYTNVFGTVEHWTNTAIANTTTTIAANTNNYSQLVFFAIPASTTSSLTPTSPLYTTYGLTSSNTAAVTISLDYSK